MDSVPLEIRDPAALRAARAEGQGLACLSPCIRVLRWIETVAAVSVLQRSRCSHRHHSGRMQRRMVAATAQGLQERYRPPDMVHRVPYPRHARLDDTIQRVVLDIGLHILASSGTGSSQVEVARVEFSPSGDLGAARHAGACNGQVYAA